MNPPPGCFYCDTALIRSRTDGFHSSNSRTTDHIIPQVRLRQMDHKEQARINGHNVVKVCSACNNYKGHLLPLDWLVIMPSDIGARRLRTRLLLLGFPAVEVTSAMARRRK